MSNTHHHPPHPAQAPATPAAPATPPYKPLAFSYPFVPADKSDAADPMTYMKALGNAGGGFYPLGANGLWHGGIHFDGQTGGVLKQDGGIRAIADGTVVAYRLDHKYPELEYRDKRSALYSTGFVLIRHELTLPPVQAQQQGATPPQGASSAPATPASAAAPASAAGAASAPVQPAQPPKPPAADTLVFFSLYMHLMDWVGYEMAMEAAKEAPTDKNAPHIEPMPFWEGDRYYRVGAKAKGKQKAPKPKTTQQPQNVDDPIGSLIQDNFKPPAQSDDADDAPPPSPVSGIGVYDLAGGKIIGLLPMGSELSVSATEKSNKPDWAKIATIKSGTPVGAVAGQAASPHVPYGWVNTKELDIVVDPKPLDQVVVLKTPFSVKAGDVIGYLGQYQDYASSSSLPPGRTNPILHLETFAGPDLPAFISRSRDRVKQSPQAQAKTFLEILPGALLVTDLPKPDQTLKSTQTQTQTQPSVHLVPVGDAKGSRWVKVQPKVPHQPTTPAAPSHPHQGNHSGHHGGHHPAPALDNLGTPLWVDASLANTVTTDVVKGWSDFPLKVANAKGPGADFRDVFRRVDLDKLGPENVAKDDKGQTWWNITIGTKDGATRQGWVCDTGHPLTRMCGPWDWPGFDLVDSSSTKPVDMLKRYLYVTEQLIEGEEKSEFEPSMSLVNAGELITKLEKAIDTNHDGKITAQELKAAQQTPWLAEAISHLVVRYESEWGGDPGKWDALSPLMKKLLWLWKSELERIGKLQWWEQVTGVDGFPTEPTPWHFHPIGLIGNFLSASSCIPLPKAQLMALTITTGFEGNHPMDYAAVANNFDGMGMSYGLIQWNAGSGTLGPLLLAMRNADPVGFKGAFPPSSNYDVLDNAITSGSSGNLYNWAVQQQSGNPTNWKVPFQNLAQIQAFKDIQVATAVNERHQHVLGMVGFLRTISPDLMAGVELVSYCALFDVAVQQTSLAPAAEQIKARVSSEHPTSQFSLIRIAVEERAKAAKHVYVADCMSRRIGILQQSPFSYTAYGVTSQRPNPNLNIISKDVHTYVCKI